MSAAKEEGGAPPLLSQNAQGLLSGIQDCLQEEGGPNFLRTVMGLIKKGVKCDGSGRAYILGEVGFEYNDEISYTPENGGSHPLKILFDKEEAQACRKKREREMWRDTTPGQYCYSPSDELGCDGVEVQKIWLAEMRKLKGESYNMDLWEDMAGHNDTPFRDLDDEALDKILAHLPSGFFTALTEVPLGPFR